MVDVAHIFVFPFETMPDHPRNPPLSEIDAEASDFNRPCVWAEELSWGTAGAVATPSMSRPQTQHLTDEMEMTLLKVHGTTGHSRNR